MDLAIDKLNLANLELWVYFGGFLKYLGTELLGISVMEAPHASDARVWCSALPAPPAWGTGGRRAPTPRASGSCR